MLKNFTARLHAFIAELYRRYIGAPDSVDFIGSAEKLPPPLTRE